MDIARPISYMFGIFFIAFATVMIFSAKIDQNVQSYVSDAVNEFVDDCCTSGYIAPQKYMRMMSKIGSTGNLYDVDLYYQSRIAMPLVEESGDVVEGAYVDSYQLYNKEEVLSEMFPNSTAYVNYPMKNGDYIKVSVSLKEPTYAGKLLMFVTKTETKTIAYSYGSYVGNNEDNGLLK